MAENRTLADFVGGKGTEQSSAPTRDAAVTSATSHRGNGRADDGEREPESTESTPDGAGSGLETTYTWTPAGAACAACGDVVARRFRDHGRLVCSACKDW